MIIYQKSDELIFKNNNIIDYDINFITQFFIHSDNKRNNEIKLCLKNNVNNNKINNIYLLNEKIYTDNELGITNNKIIQMNINKRLEYSDIFSFVHNNKLKGYIIFANSDIYLDENINILKYTYLNEEKSMMALLRYEKDNKIFGPRYDSNDTWIFHSNFNIDSKYHKPFNYQFGKPGCDNKFNYLCKVLGYKIINCPNKIKTYHVHETEIRNYTDNDKINGPYLMIEPLGFSSLQSNNQNYNEIIVQTNYFTKYNFNNNLSDYIKTKIKNNQHFIIPRIAGIENNFASIGYLIKQNIYTQNIINYINMTIPAMKNNAGILLSSIDSIILYSDLYLDAFNNCELFANWEPYGDYIKHVSDSHEFIMNTFNNKNNIWVGVYNIFHYIHDNPWTLSLENKRILLISSFEDSMKEKIAIRDKIYGIDLFPNCTFIFLKPPITNGTNDSREFNVELDNFINKIKYIINEFDIALVSCDGYGNLVCNEIYKLNKSAIYVGGVLQMYFGIYDERWIVDRKDILDFYMNEFWSRPKDNEKPDNCKNIENSCYW